MTIRFIACFACMFFIIHGSAQAACDSNALPQCQDDCTAQKYNCELGHSDELPCQQYDNSCMANCQEIVKCDESTDDGSDEVQ